MPFGSKVVIVAALTLVLTAPVAVAQENGVTVDPSSPAGKEYTLPIDQARRDAMPGGTAGTGSQASRPTPAFGEGVRPETAPSGPESVPRSGGTTDSTPRSARPAQTAASSSARTSTAEQRKQERGGIDRALVKASVGGAGASDGSLALLGGGVAVMVLGVSAGLALRRRAR